MATEVLWGGDTAYVRVPLGDQARHTQQLMRSG